MKKVKLNAKGKDLEAHSFAGSFWTEGFRKKGCDEVIIDVENDNELVLLDWNLPHTPYGNEEAKKKFEEYIKQKRKDGWRFYASWGYGLFKKNKLINPTPKE